MVHVRLHVLHVLRHVAIHVNLIAVKNATVVVEIRVEIVPARVMENAKMLAQHVSVHVMANVEVIAEVHAEKIVQDYAVAAPVVLELVTKHVPVLAINHALVVAVPNAENLV